MTILLPLGLLGLLGIAALIIIYIIRPNYQQKMISSTYVWKLSLKYRKKRIPVSRFRNILLFILQVLIIALCAFLLAYPVIFSEVDVLNTERIIVIDSSASMRVTDGTETRYQRAVAEAKTLTQSTLTAGGTVTIIMADNDPYYLAQRSTYVNADNVYASLDALLEGNTSCSYASADMDKAADLAQDILNENPQAEVYLYTGTTYIYTSEFNVIDVAAEDEWNAAVLDCTVALDYDNYYTFTIDVACYGRSEEITVHCDVEGANKSEGLTVYMERVVQFGTGTEEQTITFDSSDTPVYAWEDLHIYVQVDDSFTDDNSLYYYGGTKETITVQYVSDANNIYVPTVLAAVSYVLSDSYNIEVTEVNKNVTSYATSGFDVYIFEHSRIPSTLPTDGIVIILDPETNSSNSGFKWGGTVKVDEDTTLTSGVEHDLTHNINVTSITIAEYQIITNYDGYTPLMYYENNPIMLYKNEEDSKVVVLALDLNYSNMAVQTAFPLFMYNIFKYYLPVTVSSYIYEVGDTVSLSAKSSSLSVSGTDFKETYTEFPTEFTVTRWGTYTLTQQWINGEYLIESIYVKIPSIESNITRQVDNLPTLVVDVVTEDFTIDLLIYFAAALAALLFIEWLLQAREYF